MWPPHWRELPTFYPCIGYTNERLVYFLAEGLTFSGENMDEDEFLEILRVPFDEALAMVGDGRIDEAKTVMACSGTSASAGADPTAGRPCFGGRPSLRGSCGARVFGLA